FTTVATSNFTVETWLKPTGNSTQRVFFAQNSTSMFVSILLNTSGVPYVFVGNGSTTTSINTMGSLPLNQWSHFAFTWNASTSTIEAYVNGNLTSNVAGGSSSLGSNNIMTIGARTDGTQVFIGELDEFRIWSTVRSQCQITSSLNSDFSIVQPNLIASYSFNQGTAGGTNTTVNTLADLTGNYTGTLNNFALTGTSSNWISSGATVQQTNSNSNTQYVTDTQLSCGPYTWIDGITYTSANNTATFTSTLPNGCIQESTLDLSIVNATTGTDVQSACGSYTWINGITYTSNNTSATDTLMNSNGCDSIVTLNLTILPSSTGTDIQTSCNPYTWIDGNTYSMSNSTATHLLTNAAGCDSIVTLNFTMIPSSAGTDVQTACNSFTWIDGNTYTASNSTATYTLANAAGCDSIVTLNLTIAPTVATVTNSSPSLTCTTPNATSYQWVDCDNGYALINGATNATYVAIANGNYAVVVLANNCTDTSVCELVANVGLLEIEQQDFSIFPNPSTGIFNVQFNKVYDSNNQVIVTDLQGKTVGSFLCDEEMNTINLNVSSGYYFVSIGNQIIPIVVE
ncbi:MAG: LamG-like jellyroll fold domain-containing protein, partial [Bacteroidota bacterium]